MPVFGASAEGTPSRSMLAKKNWMSHISTSHKCEGEVQNRFKTCVGSMFCGALLVAMGQNGHG